MERRMVPVVCWVVDECRTGEPGAMDAARLYAKPANGIERVDRGGQSPFPHTWRLTTVTKRRSPAVRRGSWLVWNERRDQD